MRSFDISRYNTQYVSKLVIDKSGLKRRLRIYVLGIVLSILANLIFPYFCNLLWVKIMNIAILVLISGMFLHYRKKLLDVDKELKCIIEKR